MPSFAPILVWPLPSEPWHLAQDFSKFSFASPASALKAAAKPIAIASVIVFFIALFLFVVAALLALHFLRRHGSASRRGRVSANQDLPNASLFLRSPSKIRLRSSQFLMLCKRCSVLDKRRVERFSSRA